MKNNSIRLIDASIHLWHCYKKFFLLNKLLLLFLTFNLNSRTNEENSSLWVTATLFVQCSIIIIRCQIIRDCHGRFTKLVVNFFKIEFSQFPIPPRQNGLYFDCTYDFSLFYPPTSSLAPKYPISILNVQVPHSFRPSTASLIHTYMADTQVLCPHTTRGMHPIAFPTTLIKCSSVARARFGCVLCGVIKTI